jgi:hypothetical protein
MTRFAYSAGCFFAIVLWGFTTPPPEKEGGSDDLDKLQGT